jgi:MFS family permease
MEMIGRFQRLTPLQRNTFIACFLGWSLDAFDFFILIFCVSALAAQFQTKVSAITEAIFLTLAMRPVGALLFGLMADRFGRRPTLMVNVVVYTAFEVASAFAPSMTVFLIIRALFGIGMGGEWGVGAALAFETLPAEGRGFFSGLLQEGYVVGYLVAALAYGTLFPMLGWRGMFVIGALPAAVVLYMLSKVEESPAWLQGRVAQRTGQKGFVSDLSAEKPRIFTKGGELYRDCVQRWSATWRNSVRHLVRANRKTARHRNRGDTCNPSDSALGVFAHSTDARAGRISHAVHGAGSLGCDSRAFK